MPSSVKCPNCKSHQDIVKVFTALAITESPAFIDEFKGEKHSDMTIEQAQQIATRLNISDPAKAFCLCDDCGQPMSLTVKHEVNRMDTPVLMECPACKHNIDLRFRRDRDAICFTQEWPHVPYFNCGCKNKVLLPIRGRESWRNVAFKLVCYIRKLRGK